MRIKMNKIKICVLAALCLLLSSVSARAQTLSKSKQKNQNVVPAEQNSVSSVDIALQYNLPVRMLYFQYIGDKVQKKLDSLDYEVSGSYHLNSGRFLYNTCDELTPIIENSKYAFERTIQILRNHPELKLIIEAYSCDELQVEEREIAMEINQKRLEFARDLFLQFGLNQEQIETASYTAHDPEYSLFEKNYSLFGHTSENGGVYFRIVKR